jgi:DNA-binding Lrp family transcriptional regulator
MLTNVTSSSLAAFDSIQAHIMGDSQRKIVEAMRPDTFYTRKQLARMLGMDTSSVSGRVNELIKDEVIEVVGQIRCPISKRMVEAIKLAPTQMELVR